MSFEISSVGDFKSVDYLWSVIIDQDLDYLNLKNMDLDDLNLYIVEYGCWRSLSWGSGSRLSRYKFVIVWQWFM